MRRFTSPDEVCDALGIAFSDQQLAAISAPLEPGVVIAGAGSGKTTVMAARVVWLVGTGAVRPEEVLGLTFTRKAAAELSARVRAALARSGVVDADGYDDAGEQLVLTYDAFAARLVADHGLRIGVGGEARLITGAARFRLASRAVSAAPGPFAHVARLRPDYVTERVLALDGELASHLVDSEALIGHTEEFLRDAESSPRSRTKELYASVKKAASAACERVEVAGLVDDYQRLKRRLGAVEFADQMQVAARLVDRVPAVSSALRAQFKVVLLDEYQDTSSAQAHLLAGLFSGGDAASGRGHPVTAVGDPCQAIYTWRGAAAANIITFAAAFPRADGLPAAAYPLTVNRRSGQAILDAANALSLPLRADDDLRWAGIDTDLVAPPGTPPGDVTVASFDTWPGEVSWVADRIAASRDAGLVERWSDIAVLARRNSHIRPVYAELVARGVPVEIVGLDGLLAVPEVADVVAVLRVLADATANPDLIRVLTGPRWAIGPADLAVLGRRARALAGDDRSADGDDPIAKIADAIAQTESARMPSLAEALADPGDGPYTTEGAARLRAAALELASLRAHVGAPVIDLVRRVVTTLGLEVELGLRGPGGGRQLEAFVAQVSGYADVDGDGSLTGLLAWLSAEEEHGVGLEQAVISDDDSVKLLTIHKAKGLEWDLVFLPALADKVFPSDRIQGNWLARSDVLPADLRGDADHVPQLAEVSDPAGKEYEAALRAQARRGDDRLAYVAVTRARRHLVATTHAWSELLRPRTPSPYYRVLAAFGATAVDEEVSATNPLLRPDAAVPWPQPVDAAVRARRTEAADAVRRVLRDGPPPDEPLGGGDAALVRAWDEAAGVLVAEARARRVRTPASLPPYLSATALMALRADAGVYLDGLARPMPAPPRRAARVGERFHAWLERRHGLAPTLPAEDADADADAATDALSGDGAAAGSADGAAPPSADLARLIAAFESGPFADRVPAASEVPFALFLAGQVVRGRIDAVFTDGVRPLVVDWKTGGGARTSDPLQLALYRLAWAELSGLEPEQVDAAFYDVLARRLVRPGALPGRADLESLVGRLAAER